MRRRACLALALLAFSLPPTRLPAQESERFALVIGVAGYPGYRPENRLLYADSDAVRFRDYLVDPAGGGFRPANVLLFTDRAATRDSVAKAVRWLARNVRNSDELYVFFSGHAQEELGNVYFMPYDGREDNPAGQGWEAGQFWEMFRSVPRRYLVMFVDACYAASLVDPGARGHGGDDLRRALDAALAGQPPQDVALLSSAGTQLSFEDPEIHGGLFTHYLLQALRGAANETGLGNRDSVVTVREVMRYVVDSVEARSLARFARRQSPQHTGGTSPSFPLAAVRPPDASRGGSAAEEIRAGNLSTGMRDFADARRHYQAALAIDPANSEAGNRLAFTYYGEQRYGEALAAYRQASERDPRNFLGRRNWGEVAMLLDDTAEAIRAYTQAAAVNPNDPVLLDDLSIALAERDPAAALHYAAAGVRLAPGNAHLRLSLGELLYDRGEIERAMEQWTVVTQMDRGPAATAAYQSLASEYWKVGEFNAALQAVQAVFALEPDDSTKARLQVAQSLTGWVFRSLEDSTRQWRERLQAFPHERAIESMLINAYGNWMFEPDSVLAANRRWRQANPADSLAQVESAVALLELGRYAESRATLDSARIRRLPVADRVALEALSLVDDCALGDGARAVGRLQAIRAYLAQRPDRSASLGWTFNGIRHHVRGSPVLGPYRYGILALLEALQHPSGLEMQSRLATLELSAAEAPQ